MLNKQEKSSLIQTSMKLEETLKKHMKNKNAIFINHEPEKNYEDELKKTVNNLQKEYQVLIISSTNIKNLKAVKPKEAVQEILRNSYDFVFLINLSPFCKKDGIWVEFILQICRNLIFVIFMCPFVDLSKFSRWFSNSGNFLRYFCDFIDSTNDITNQSRVNYRIDCDYKNYESIYEYFESKSKYSDNEKNLYNSPYSEFDRRFKINRENNLHQQNIAEYSNININNKNNNLHYFKNHKEIPVDTDNISFNASNIDTNRILNNIRSYKNYLKSEAVCINIPTRVKIRVYGYFKSKNPFTFDIKLNYKIDSFIRKQTVIVASTSKTCELTATNLYKRKNMNTHNDKTKDKNNSYDNSSNLNTSQNLSNDYIKNKKSCEDYNFEDQRIQSLADAGISFINNETSKKDEQKILSLFEKKKINVLVILLDKLPIKCDTLIIKSTYTYYNSTFVQYEVNDLVKCLTSLSTHSFLYILTEKDTEYFYKSVFLHAKKIQITDIYKRNALNLIKDQRYTYSIIENKILEYVLTFLHNISTDYNMLHNFFKDSFFYYVIGDKKEILDCDSLLIEALSELQKFYFIESFSTKYVNDNLYCKNSLNWDNTFSSKFDGAYYLNKNSIAKTHIENNNNVINQKNCNFNADKKKHNCINNYKDYYRNITNDIVIRKEYTNLYYQNTLPIHIFYELCFKEHTEYTLLEYLSEILHFVSKIPNTLKKEYTNSNFAAYILMNKQLYQNHHIILSNLVQLIFDLKLISKISLGSACILLSKVKSDIIDSTSTFVDIFDDDLIKTKYCKIVFQEYYIQIQIKNCYDNKFKSHIYKHPDNKSSTEIDNGKFNDNINIKECQQIFQNQSNVKNKKDMISQESIYFQSSENSPIHDKKINLSQSHKNRTSYVNSSKTNIQSTVYCVIEKMNITLKHYKFVDKLIIRKPNTSEYKLFIIDIQNYKRNIVLFVKDNKVTMDTYYHKYGKKNNGFYSRNVTVDNINMCIYVPK
ncbi:hypothetical protein EDEG_02273 [Edhazardia aedis USNM 41457]|uniref:Uncharacterized protein n=1 Tax=Edhazardia aedis (strain USNM 41457) TaxID=1003232 RepID=J9DLB6_EDHAE|nr:hypothetical protein EDEG_02273 [Edhazardia aedis USNM 41457]|eukprot:EJW03385.1 hypothetical protein EDEG_02273 [Edhazardia aedis USNM 41457]